MNYQNSILFLVLSISSFYLSASSQSQFEKASMAACEKLKKCALQEVESQDIPPEMRQMVENMAASMCTNLIAFSQVEPYKELYVPAAQCMQSLADKSCTEMQDDVETPECKNYEKLAKKYIDNY